MDNETRRWADATRRHIDVEGRTPGHLAERLRWPGGWVSRLLDGSLEKPLSRWMKVDLFKAFAADREYERRGDDIRMSDLSYFSDEEILQLYEKFDPRLPEVDLEVPRG
ncbi:MAG: hypothetical protein HYU86_10535 [Chloroflexi bacterium]|nr:hypothetical protein [Chloroflexota bacterium]